jgi:ribosome-associated protein
MGDVVAHVFHRDEREFYHLEGLWSDAKSVEFA